MPNLREYCCSRRNFKHLETRKNPQRKLQMKWSSSSSITVNETEFSPCYTALKKRELTNNIGRCVTKRGTDYLAPRANRLARLSKFYISGAIMTYYQFKHLVVSAESYHEGAEPNQAKLERSRKRHKV